MSKSKIEESLENGYAIGNGFHYLRIKYSSKWSVRLNWLTKLGYIANYTWDGDYKNYVAVIDGEDYDYEVLTEEILYEWFTNIYEQVYEGLG
jgi:hypothetical protein